MAITYDPSVDYSDLIAQEAAKGVNANANLLAQYEQQRNQKITDQGLSIPTTNIYSGGYGLGASDAGVVGGGSGGGTQTNVNGAVSVGGSGNGGYYTARDQSGYINDLYDAAASRAEAALKGAYDEAVLGFDAAEEQIPIQYRAARNQTSADAAVQRANLNEQLNASGLNTGASGQARLAMGVAEQNAMAALNRQQQAAIDEITLQRNQARVQYETAVAQAIADNDIERARALYEEAVRVDNSWRSELEDLLLQQQYQMNQLSMEATRQQMELERQAYQAALTGGSGVGGGGGGGGDDVPGKVDEPLLNPYTGERTPQETLDVGTQLQQMMASGASPAEMNAFLASAEAQGLINTAERMQFTRYAGLDGYAGTSATPAMSSYAQTLLSQLSSIPGLTEANKVGMVNDAINNGRLTDIEADYLLYYLGY